MSSSVWSSTFCQPSRLSSSVLNRAPWLWNCFSGGAGAGNSFHARSARLSTKFNPTVTKLENGHGGVRNTDRSLDSNRKRILQDENYTKTLDFVKKETGRDRKSTADQYEERPHRQSRNSFKPRTGDSNANKGPQARTNGPVSSIFSEENVSDPKTLLANNAASKGTIVANRLTSFILPALLEQKNVIPNIVSLNRMRSFYHMKKTNRFFTSQDRSSVDRVTVLIYSRGDSSSHQNTGASLVIKSDSTGEVLLENMLNMPKSTLGQAFFVEAIEGIAAAIAMEAKHVTLASDNWLMLQQIGGMVSLKAKKMQKMLPIVSFMLKEFSSVKLANLSTEDPDFKRLRELYHRCQTEGSSKRWLGGEKEIKVTGLVNQKGNSDLSNPEASSC